MEHQQRMERDRARIEAWLRGAFAGRERYGRLYEAMEYSLLAGGKRIRPVLTLACCRLCGGEEELALPLGCAVEMVHTYSLIHDDLPCMDDDDLRRGRPTNHVVFGEAAAVLAGDALLTAAFEVLAGCRGKLPEGRVLEAVDCLSRAAGARGMVGGQILDMEGEGRTLTLEELERLQSLKTGALISAAAEMGCIAAGASREQRQAVATYAQCLGRAFQIQDDILDVTSTDEELGKSVGSDQANGKSTFVTALGLEECRRLTDRLTRRGVQALEGMPGAEFLTWLAGSLARRRT